MNIVIWPFMKSSKWYRTLVSKLICFFTNSNYTHSAIYLNGYLYESTVMNGQNGAMKTKGLPPAERNCIVLEFKKPVNPADIEHLEYALNRRVVEKRPYNFFKIFVLAIIYPTRWLWNAIGWVPFQNEAFGYVCSVFVDSALKQFGIDLIPDNNEEYSSPGDILNSDLLKPVK